MSKEHFDKTDLYLVGFHVSPKTECPYYASIVGPDVMPIMKNGNIIFFEQLEQINHAYLLADNKDMLEGNVLPTPESEAVVYDFDAFRDTILYKKKDLKSLILHSFLIFDDLISSINFSPPNWVTKIYNDCLEYFMVEKYINKFCSKYSHKRENIVDAAGWYLKSIQSRSLLLKSNGTLTKPTCNAASILHEGKQRKTKK